MATNLVERPVDGSTVQSLRPVNPQPRASWGGALPVAKTSAEKARHQTKWFLRSCQDIPDDDVIDDAILLISELVTNAYTAMATYNALSGMVRGTTFDFSLRLFDDRLLIEVIDTSPEAPELNPPKEDAFAEDGRGLGLVEGLSADWGYFWHGDKKVVYAVLPITNGQVENGDVVEGPSSSGSAPQGSGGATADPGSCCEGSAQGQGCLWG
jgi:Histidine kinase-like ATPase domain